jgi:hypothetical protein
LISSSLAGTTTVKLRFKPWLRVSVTCMSQAILSCSDEVPDETLLGLIAGRLERGRKPGRINDGQGGVGAGGGT